jgi:hypothetical protein
MATYTNLEKVTWEFADNKQDFDTWLEANPEQSKAWLNASELHSKWRIENPNSNLDDNPHHDAASEIFHAWIDYADAKIISQ